MNAPSSPETGQRSRHDNRHTTHEALWQEYESGIGQMPLRVMNRLCERGVTIQAFDDLPGPTWICIQRSGKRFEPCRDGSFELIFPAWRDGYLIDLLAWDGKSFACRIGREPILGFETLFGWCDWLRPLRVFSDPVDWLAAEGAGIVIVDTVAAWRILWNFEHFSAENLPHGIELRKLLTPPARNPDIQVPGEVLAHELA